MRTQTKDVQERKGDMNIFMRDTHSPFVECTLKCIYIHFRDVTFEQLTANNYWQTKYTRIDTSQIWKNIRSTIKSPALESFDFFVAHNCVMNGMRLLKMHSVDTDVCKVCGKESEGPKHMFFYCEELTGFINMLKNF